MTGILRSGQLWHRVLGIAQQHQRAPILAISGRRFFAEQSKGGQQARNPSKVPTPSKITLNGPEGSISITSLEEAQKLAKRRGLKLVKEIDFDGKSHRAVYKLITIAKIKQEEGLNAGTEKSKSTATTKSDKMLNLSNKIAEHDLQSRLKHIDKWLSKQHKVIVVISGSVSDLATSEKIYKQMEEMSLGKGKIIQKRTKGSEIRFQILPTPPKEMNSPEA